MDSFIQILLAILVSAFLSYGALLWLVKFLFRVEGIGWGRSVLVCLPGALAGLSFNVLSLVILGIPRDGLMTLLLAAILISLSYTVVSLFLIKVGFRVSLGKSILMWLAWSFMCLTVTVCQMFGLRIFAIEIFVVPTGAMAEAVLGYHKDATCPECGYSFAVNSSKQALRDAGMPPVFVAGCTCPNCLYSFEFPGRVDPPVLDGDRILVAKAGYGTVQRHQLVTFAYPPEPVVNGLPMNYIKRLIGLPGETIAIQAGQIYTYDQPRQLPKVDQCWAESSRSPYAWPDDPEGQAMFQDRKFRIIRKPPPVMLALSRVVYDNDHQAKDLAGRQPFRWQAQTWQADDPNQPRRFTITPTNDGIAWLRYHHLLRGRNKPELITDFMGYNTGVEDGFSDTNITGSNWAGDLMLECQVELRQATGELVLELSKGVDRFQARFELATGRCALVRLTPSKDGTDATTELASRNTSVTGTGTFLLRFANYDDRLTLWIDDELPFAEGVSYDAPAELGPTAKNDLQPVSIGAKGAGVTVSNLKILRDTVYTTRAVGVYSDTNWSDPDQLEQLRNPAVRIFDIQPGHYFLLGDNSSQSSDSRVWGMVPEGNIIGPVKWRYLPFARFGAVH